MDKQRPRRAHGEGSIFNAKGYWYAAISLGRDQNGRRLRRTVIARSKAEAQRKLLEMLVERDAQQQLTDPGITWEVDQPTRQRREIPMPDLSPRRSRRR